MKSIRYRLLVVAALAVACAVVITTRKPTAGTPSGSAGLPRLLELGSVSCIPCKAMEPILEELRRDYPGKLQVDFVDVLKRREIGQMYNIEIIPTQIFFDAQGKEFFRHTGFFPKEKILATFKGHGIDLPVPGSTP